MGKPPVVKIVIDVEQGLVANVSSNVPFDYVVCDMDVEGAMCESDILELTCGAFIHHTSIQEGRVDVKDVETVFADIERANADV